jgi:hypothetical protein
MCSLYTSAWRCRVLHKSLWHELDMEDRLLGGFCCLIIVL